MTRDDLRSSFLSDCLHEFLMASPFGWLRPTVCAVVGTSGHHAHATDVAAALDVLFDWFDRHGCRALDAPSLSIENDNARLRTEVTWAFERIIT